MIGIIFIINACLSVYLILFYESIFINQYYSTNRYIKVIIQKNTYSNFKIIKNRITRKNITLFIISFFLSFFIPFFLSCITVLISYIIMLPIEMIIDNHYYRLAKDKIAEDDLTIIGVTGSYGKTTLRNYIFEFLKSYYTVYTPKGNINTPKGITKYINNTFLKKNSILVLELGIDEEKGMNVFKKFLVLDYGFVTSIGDSHLSTFKTKERIYEAKMRITSLLKEEGRLFLNKNDNYLCKYQGKCVFYDCFKCDEVSYSHEGISLKYQGKEVSLKIFNDYALLYIGALFELSKVLDIKDTMFFEGIKNIKQIHRRQEVIKLCNGYLINDSYNANISSVISSLELLDRFDGVSYIIFSGLIEQGENKEKSEEKLKSHLKNRNMIFVGNKNHTLVSSVEYNDLVIVATIDEAYKVLERIKYNNLLVFPVGEKIHLN